MTTKNGSRVQPSPLPSAGGTKVPVRLFRPTPKPKVEGPRSSTAARLGPQVRALRLAAGVSLAALAGVSGVSRSMLSRIERGVASPSIEAMDRISEALGVPISRFFVDQPRRADCSFVPAGRGIAVDREGVIKGYHYELIGHLLSGNLFVEPYIVRLSEEAEEYTTFQHPGTKFLYILSGRGRYRYANRVMEVAPGDSLLFDATALHGFERIVETPVSYLTVIFTLRE